MTGTKSKRKGATGEREFLGFVSNALDIEIHRNHLSAKEGGHDTLGLVCGFAIEVKRAEQLRLTEWWAQTITQARQADGYPALAYRRNREEWSVRMYLEHMYPSVMEPHISGRVVTLPRHSFIYLLKNWRNYYVKRQHFIYTRYQEPKLPRLPAELDKTQ